MNDLQAIPENLPDPAPQNTPPGEAQDTTPPQGEIPQTKPPRKRIHLTFADFIDQTPEYQAAQARVDQAAKDGSIRAPGGGFSAPAKPEPSRAQIAGSLDLVDLIESLPAPLPARKTTRRPRTTQPYVPGREINIAPERDLVAPRSLVKAIAQAEGDPIEDDPELGNAPQGEDWDGEGPQDADPGEDSQAEPELQAGQGGQDEALEPDGQAGGHPHRPQIVCRSTVDGPQASGMLYGKNGNSGKAIEKISVEKKFGEKEKGELRTRMARMAKVRGGQIKYRQPGEPIPKTKLERIKAVILDLQNKRIEARALPRSIKMRIVQYFLEVQPEVTNPAIGDLIGEERQWVWKAKRELIRDAIFAVTDLDANDLLSGFRIHKEAMQAKALEKGDYWSAFKMEKEFLEKMADFGLVPRAVKVEERRNLNIDLTKEMGNFVREFGVPTPGELMKAIKEGKKTIGIGPAVETKVLTVKAGKGGEDASEDPETD